MRRNEWVKYVCTACEGGLCEVHCMEIKQIFIVVGAAVFDLQFACFCYWVNEAFNKCEKAFNTSLKTRRVYFHCSSRLFNGPVGKNGWNYSVIWGQCTASKQCYYLLVIWLTYEVMIQRFSCNDIDKNQICTNARPPSRKMKLKADYTQVK